MANVFPEAECVPYADCPVACGWAFERVRCFPTIRGGTRVEWFMNPAFADPFPETWTFQLEVGTGGDHDVSDWTAVGPPATNTWWLFDEEERVFGLQQWTHYRILLTTPRGSYLSDPAPCLGALDFRHWRIMQGIIRAETKAFQVGQAQEGFLLKRRVSGTPCPCLDTMTEEPRRPLCQECYGTGWLGGYFQPLGCIFAQLTQLAVHSHVEPEGTRGAGGDVTMQARMLAVPQLQEKDVWIDRFTDMRYAVHTIKPACEVKGVPVVYDPVELRLLPFTNPVYKIIVPEQVTME